MSLFDRLVLSGFMRYTGLSLASFGSIYLLVDFFEKFDDFIENQAPVSLYFSYFLNLIPLIVSQLIPLAILMGTFMALATLARHGELTAMHAAGVSLFRITRSILAAGLLISLFMLGYNEYFLPFHIQSTHEAMNRAKKKSLVLKLSGIWFRENKAIVHVKLADPDKGQIKGVHIYRMDDDFNIVSDINTDRADFKNGGWVGQHVDIQNFAPRTSALLEKVRVPEKNLGISKKPGDFRDLASKRAEMNFRKLRALANRLKNEGYDAAGYEVDMHNRLAAPFACTIMAFMGIPFALRGSRRAGLSLGVVFSVGVGISYYFINAILQAFGYSSVLPPLVATWGANLLFFLFGLYLLLSKQG